MKGNKISVIVFIGVLLLYIIAEMNAPRKFDWTPTLSNKDRNPFGAVVPFTKLGELFPGVVIENEREPLYNVLHDAVEINSAYILLEPSFKPGKVDLEEMLLYVQNGNTVFISAFEYDEKFLDTLGLKTASFAALITKDSTTINFVNPSLKAPHDYGFKKNTIDGFFSEVNKKDSSRVLGINQDSLPNFVKVQYGEGFFLMHAAPLCFSNYFMLFQNNAGYTAKALSYIPANIETLHWDEYYKAGREGADTPLRFFLSNLYLKWALYLTIAALLLYVLFEMKRRQRSIPVIEPLRNTTLDFVETVSGVYYSRHDNNSIATKKIQFWFDYIRRHYYLSTNKRDNVFMQSLQRKSGVPEELIKTILTDVKRAEAQPKVTDDLLMQLSAAIDEFYKLSKT